MACQREYSQPQLQRVYTGCSLSALPSTRGKKFQAADTYLLSQNRPSNHLQRHLGTRYEAQLKMKLDNIFTSPKASKQVVSKAAKITLPRVKAPLDVRGCL